MLQCEGDPGGAGGRAVPGLALAWMRRATERQATRLPVKSAPPCRAPLPSDTASFSQQCPANQPPRAAVGLATTAIKPFLIIKPAGRSLTL